MRLKKLALLTIFVMIIASVLTIVTVKTDGINKATGFVTYHLYKRFKIIKVEEFEVFAQISNSSGWNMETNRLNFGKMTPGGAAGRFMALKNEFEYDIIIKMRSEGEMKNWLEYPKEIHLEPNEGKEIHIGASAPGFPRGNYTGRFIITYYKR